jgi:hypothetical protein
MREQPGKVARAGIEPATFHFSGERYYRLSYLASDRCDGFNTAYATPTGLEPATSAVTGRRANQLRHGALLAQGTHPSGRPRNYSAAEGVSGKWRRWQASAHDGCRRLLTLWLLVPLRSPSSRGLGLRPFKAATRVRIPLGTQDHIDSDKAGWPLAGRISFALPSGTRHGGGRCQLEAP